MEVEQGQTLDDLAKAGWAVVPAAQSTVKTAPEKPSTSTALEMASAAGSVPVATRAALEVATNPNVPRVGSALGQVAGGVEGALKAGPLGAASGAWTGGRAGWFTGKLAQKLAMPVAKVAEALAPYAQTLSTLSGAQGVADLAQMAEPNRKDIGVLGVGSGSPDPNHPALLNVGAIARISAELYDHAGAVPDGTKQQRRDHQQCLHLDLSRWHDDGRDDLQRYQRHAEHEPDPVRLGWSFYGLPCRRHEL